MAKQKDNSIDAMPTKQLFIYMLTRDIGLIPAIIDLADNSGDGARRLRGTKRLDGLTVRLSLSPTMFKIADNCGGISIEVARTYAFRFGRDEDTPSVKHSVGQFGVGMKRAIFKLGEDYVVESTTDSEYFKVAENVPAWATKKAWTFEFAKTETGMKNSAEKCGTIITVKTLHPDVSDAFGLDSFKTELRSELQSRLVELMSRGMVISLNGVPIDAEPLKLLSDRQIAPAFKKFTYKSKGKKTVTVRLFCGLGKSDDRDAAGWHVFCNGRLVLEGDKSEVTGWGSNADGVRIPGFHGQYNHLRGFAYFDCDDAGRLPWNTTKTGIDSDSAIYRSVRLHMMQMMRPVVDFLNRLKDEKQSRADDEDKGALEAIVNKAKEVELSAVKIRDVFKLPPISNDKKPATPMQHIGYYKPAKQVDKVKEALNASSFKAVGERTFDYFYESEIG